MRFLIPPRTILEREGTFSAGTQTTVASVHDSDRIPVRGLIADLGACSCSARLTRDTQSARIVVRRDKSVRDPEGYRISIRPDRVTVRSGTDAGAYYGIQTLRGLVRNEGTSLECMEIDDRPALARRGFYLDCSRGKVPTVGTVKQLVERLAHWKLNELELYVENVFTFTGHPEIGVGFSPFTPEDIREIGEHCRLHHVRLVPSLTSLGHFEKILMLPGYEDLGELPGYGDLPGGTTLNPLDPRSVALLADLYSEFLPLFDADDFNACGDEPWELGQGRSRERAEEVGVGRVYLDFIMKIRALSLAHGKRMNMWGDIVLKHPEIIPEIPPEVVLLNWDYSPNGSMMTRTGEFVDAGLPLVCCPGTHGWQSHGTRLRTSMRNIHQFAGIAIDAGAEGLLNTDWGDGGHRNSLGVSLHGMAYGAAASWNHASVPGPESDEFTEAFCRDTFGDADGRLVPVLATIGDDDYHNWAYHAIMESVQGPDGFGRGFAKARALIGEVKLSDEELERKIDVSSALLVPAAFPSLAGFEQTALREYALANSMNRAAARRVLIARRVRAGRSPDAETLSTHEEELAAIRRELEEVWMVRNRPSRLADSLTGLDQALAEVRELRGR